MSDVTNLLSDENVNIADVQVNVKSQFGGINIYCRSSGDLPSSAKC